MNITIRLFTTMIEKIKQIGFPKVWMMMVFSTIVLTLYYNPIYSQDENKSQNLQSYTPSILLKKGQLEVKSFQNLYSQSASFGEGFDLQMSNTQTTYFTSINQFYWGINSKINVGFDVWMKGVNISGKSEGIGSYLEFSQPEGRFSPLYAGPKIKFVISRLKVSYEASLLIPLENDFEGRTFEDSRKDLFLEPDRYLYVGNLYADRSFTDQWQVFLRFSQWLSFPRESYLSDPYLETPIAGFLSYFPNQRWSLYLMNEWWVKHIDGPFNSFFMQVGPGLKYQIIPGILEIEGLYTRFALGAKFEGAGNTYNFGVRFLR